MKKTIHTVLSVLLCCVLLTAFMPLVYAEDTLIEEAFATFTVPMGGEAMDFSAVTVPLHAHYTAKIVKVYTRDGKNIADGDAVTGGTTYTVRVSFTADRYYRFEDGKTAYTVNGETISETIATGLVETSFVAEGEAPADPTPASPTFRDRVATFFRDMRNRFIFLKLWLRSLFKIK